MLPPGHIAAGYLVADALIKTFHPDLTPVQINHLLWWGAFFGFAPDLDTFIAFARVKAWVFTNKSEVNHRRFSSHAPLLWMVPGVLIYFFATTSFLKTLGLVWWLSSWSHFFLDTIQFGIMWLWPWKKTIYAFKDKEKPFQIQEYGFFAYWWGFVKAYSKELSFYLEACIIIITLIILTI